MIASHEPWLVMLSLLVAIQGSYVGLSLSLRVTNRQGVTHRGMLAVSAFALAMAIWSMHFVGMLAFVPPLPVDYFVLPTLVSFLVCVLFVGFTVVIARFKTAGRAHFIVSAMIMGGGIATMHYLGMMALHANAHMTHDHRFVLASILVAVFASGLALHLAYRTDQRGGRSLAASAVVLGLAISAMHYTAMAGLELTPFDLPQTDTPVLSRASLAIIVAIVAFLVSGLFLLTLVPERVDAAGADQRQNAPATDTDGEAPRESMSSSGRLAASWPADPRGFDHATITPTPVLNGPQKTVWEAKPEGVQASGTLAARTAGPAGHLPIEREGRSERLETLRLIAVHADAHYTRLVDDDGSYFCPWPISRVERALDSRKFARVHRSHIVNLERVEGVRRAGDTGILQMSATGETGSRIEVPVARARWSRIRKRLAEIEPLHRRVAE